MLETYQNALLQLHPVQWAIIGLFALLFLFQIVYILLFNLRAARHKSTPGKASQPISLLMVLRNEEDNLRSNLPPVLSLPGTEIEVVAVDNYSLDNSHLVLQSIQTTDQRVRISRLKQDTDFSEKMAQNIGLKAARYDWILPVAPSTSAFGTEWLSHTSSMLNGSNDVVVSYSNVAPTGSFFNLLYRTEFFFQQLRSFGFILNGMPFVVAQENVAFKKEKYFGVGGYRGRITESLLQLEMVINSFITRKNVSLSLTGKTAILENRRVSFKDYIDLIKREKRLREYLPSSVSFWLVLHNWVNFLMLPVAAAVVLLVPMLWTVVLIMMSLLVLANVFIIKKLLKDLNERKLFLPSFLIALFLPVLRFIFGAVYGSYGRRKGWKKVI